uniref:Uncharacterized protein n=1 Tax=Amphimedon queenslandica TaxID=400682 RepID=A0A1X7U1E4_AMPQE
MARQYDVEEAFDLAMNDDSHEVLSPHSDHQLGFEEDDNKCVLATDVTIDDTVVSTTTDFDETGTEPATTSSPAGDVDLSSPSTPAATITDHKWTNFLEPVYVAEFTQPVCLFLLHH